MDLGYVREAGRKPLKLRNGASLIDDLKVLDMYEDATQDYRPLAERKDNWVQNYYSEDDLLRIIDEQFNRYSELHAQLIQSRARDRGAKK